MWLVLIAGAAPASLNYAETMARYGIPGLLVFAAGVLLPAALKSRKGLGGWVRFIVAGIWVLILGAAVVWVVAQAKQEFRKKWVIEGVTTGIEDPQKLSFDDDYVYTRKLINPGSGRTRWEWAVVKDSPTGGQKLTLMVLGSDDFTLAAFEITAGEEPLQLHFDAAKGELHQVSPPTDHQPKRVEADPGSPASRLALALAGEARP